jgi:hypothetical protein
MCSARWSVPNAETLSDFQSSHAHVLTCVQVLHTDIFSGSQAPHSYVLRGIELLSTVYCAVLNFYFLNY